MGVMMKIYGIADVIRVLILSFGMVCAVDLGDFKAPSGFDDGSENSMDRGNFSITMENYDGDSDYKNFFEPTDLNNITVKGKIAEFRDNFHDSVGVMEIIRLGEAEYVVKCTYHDYDPSKIGECVNYIWEFSKINGLPVELITDNDDS